MLAVTLLFSECLGMKSAPEAREDGDLAQPRLLRVCISLEARGLSFMNHKLTFPPKATVGWVSCLLHPKITDRPPHLKMRHSVLLGGL